MNRFVVGDVVEVIEAGRGIGSQHIGKRTMITAIGGTYCGEEDAVQTKDFSNPQYEDWISKRSFKLIKAAKRIVFKTGDKVAVVECARIKAWRGWRDAIGKIYTLNSDQAGTLTKGLNCPLGDNKYQINFSPEMLEKF